MEILVAITLGEDLPPGWLDLYNDAALYMKRADTFMVQMAQARADALLAELQDAGVAVTKAGGTIVNIPDITDEDAQEGFRRTLFIVSLAELGTEDWKNVLDGKGNPIPFDASLLARLFADPLVSGNFLGRYLAGALREIEAGNV